MTHLEKLQTRLEELNTLLDAIDAARSKVYDQERMDLMNVLEKFFVAQEGDIVECSHQSVNIRKKGDDKFNNFLTIYVDDRWNKDDSKTYNKLYINNYSFRTDEMAEWIVERFEKQAHYTRIAVDFQDDILAEMNQINSDATQIMIEIAKPAKELRKEAREIREEISVIKKEARLKALMSEEGLAFEGIERERFGSKFLEFPDFKAKFDWTIPSVRSIKVTRITPSGKSADVTVKVQRQVFDEKSGEWGPKIVDQAVERVKIENIENLLRQANVFIDSITQ